jgi:CRISPR/Cas system CSM-associated protein Csm2 small subunit
MKRSGSHIGAVIPDVNIATVERCQHPWILQNRLSTWMYITFQIYKAENYFLWENIHGLDAITASSQLFLRKTIISKGKVNPTHNQTKLTLIFNRRGFKTIRSRILCTIYWEKRNIRIMRKSWKQVKIRLPFLDISMKNGSTESRKLRQRVFSHSYLRFMDAMWRNAQKKQYG